MRDLSATDPLFDELEALIDEALEDPARAPAVKARIKARLGGANRGAAPLPHRPSTDADDEDLWDNIPF